jgi:hypothetical protein
VQAGKLEVKGGPVNTQFGNRQLRICKNAGPGLLLPMRFRAIAPLRICADDSRTVQ